MAEKFILILGGVRSGKSRFAQSMAAKLGEKVLFVATGEPLDEEMALRIEEHKRIRPKNWRTLEIDIKVGQKLKERIEDVDVVLLDCLTLLVSNILTKQGGASSCHSEGAKRPKNLAQDRLREAISEAEKQVMAEMEDLIECIERYEGSFIVVSNEVGLGLVPESKLGRVYRDLLGKANQLLAQRADEVYFMAAGIPVKLKGAS